MGSVAGEREGAALRGPVRSLTGLRCALLNDSLRAGSLRVRISLVWHEPMFKLCSATVSCSAFAAGGNKMM